MAQSGTDIQVENGNWAKVHNLILRTLAKADLTGRESKCLFFLLSMTYGKQEKEHEISLTLWADGTGIDKRHVKPIIDRLVERNIVNRIDGGKGRGHTMIYGFNKYFELWDKEEKVPSTVPIEKVPPIVPFNDEPIEEKVPSTVPEKVPSTVPTKERSFKSSLLTPTDEENSKALVVQAYQTVCKIGPPMREEKGKAALVVALGLIEKFGYEACIRSLATLKERYYAALDKNQRRGIDAPLPYLRSIMEGIEESPRFLAPATVDFALEDITQ